ncbi:tetratricopeptide repeat protein [Tenacibaculum sp. MEBiC06402]|uniref:tetratricopeptide repeat protein n=1 Tax=unclassified Tenacibaculum TaxID=2635139 RepID=UPI003B9D1D02
MKIKIISIVLVVLCIGLQAQKDVQSIDSLIEIGRYKKALLQLSLLSESFQKNYKIASVYEAIDNHREASFYYKKSLRFKDDYKTKIKLGKSLLKEKKYTQVVKLYEEICAKDSENLIAKYTLGKLYLQVNQYSKAKIIFGELIADDNENANYYYQYALSNPQPKKIFKRIDYYLLAHKKDNKHFNAIEKLARSFTIIKDRDSALVFIDKGLELRPNHIDLNRLKINSLFRKKKYNQSINLLKHIDSIQPNEHFTHKMLGRSYFNIEEYDLAEKHFQKASRLDIDDFRSMIYLGDIAMKNKNPRMAMFYYMSGTTRGKQKRDRAYMGLANVFSEMKKPRNVLKSYESAVEENANNYKALFAFAKQSDNYYKDKKIGYNLYKTYLEKFEGKDSITDNFVRLRLKEIKKEYFLKGEILE